MLNPGYLWTRGVVVVVIVVVVVVVVKGAFSGTNADVVVVFFRMGQRLTR